MGVMGGVVIAEWEVALRTENHAYTASYDKKHKDSS
jgi:hypothetical protein